MERDSKGRWVDPEQNKDPEIQEQKDPETKRAKTVDDPICDQCHGHGSVDRQRCGKCEGSGRVHKDDAPEAP